jgi:hypothetical protein
MREALAPIVAGTGVELVEFDVDSHPWLEDRYGDLVPVLLQGDASDGREICRYHLDAAAVRRVLADR